MRLLELFSIHVRGFLRSVACVLTLWTLAGAAQTSIPPDREKIAAEAESLWLGLSHIEIEGKTEHPDSDLVFGFEVNMTNDGRSSVRDWRAKEESRISDSLTLQDGRRRYQLERFPLAPEIVHDVLIENQEGDETSYVGPMNDFLWVWLPCGKPLHRHLADGAKLGVEGASGLVRVDTRYKRNPVTIVYDPDKDWLPRKVVIGDDFYVLNITRYGRDGGRWVPLAGEATRLIQREGEIVHQESSFEVTKHHVNRPVVASEYQPPPLMPGVLIRDVVKDSREIVGEEADRIKLFEQYDPAALHPIGNRSSHDRRARGTSSSVPHPRPLLLLSGVGLLGIAGVVYMRRPHRG